MALVQMKNTADAEDVLQDTFLQLVAKKPKFESEDHLKAWLLRVALNRCHSLHRSSWWRKTVSLSEELIAPQSDESDSLLTVVYSLPPKYREVIHLYYYEDLSVEDVAKILNIKYDAAAQRLARARKMLKEKLKGESGYDRLEKRI